MQVCIRYGASARGSDALSQCFKPFQSDLHRVIGQRNEPPALLESTQLHYFPSADEFRVDHSAVKKSMAWCRGDVISISLGGPVLGDQDGLRASPRGLELDQVD